MPKEEKKHIVSLLEIILFVIFLGISLSFFYLLENKLGLPFNISDSLIAIVVSIAATLFLLWVKSMMSKNIYIGALAGIAGLAISLYALFLRFNGPYTTVYGSIISAVTIGYLVYVYFVSKK